MKWFSKEDEGKILSPEMVDEALDRVYNKAVERALALMPSAVSSLIKYAANLDTIQEGFMKNNKDLVEHTDRLKELIGVTSSDHPDWDIAKIVEESGKDLRRELKTASSIGAMDLTSLGAPSKEDLDGTKIKDS